MEISFSELKMNIKSLKYLDRFNELYNSFTDIKGLHKFEAYSLYMFFRTYMPKKIIEMSPNYGFSTYIMINAINDENYEIEFFKTYDIVDCMNKKILSEAKKLKNFTFIVGNAMNTLKIEEEIDFWFIDSDHSYSFAKWYVKYLEYANNFFVHDIFPYREFQVKYRYNNENINSGGEPLVIYDWLNENGCSYKNINDIELINSTIYIKNLNIEYSKTDKIDLFWNCILQFEVSNAFDVNQQSYSLFVKKK